MGDIFTFYAAPNFLFLLEYIIFYPFSFQFTVHQTQEKDRLTPLCAWATHFRLCQSVRRKWRRGGERIMTLENSHLNGHVTCYDCDEELVCLGTNSGHLVTWDTGTGLSKNARGIVNSKVDKIYIRHSLVTVMQGGLIQVFSVDASMQLLYCKSTESPDRQQFDSINPDDDDDYFIPKLPQTQLVSMYKPMNPLKYTDIDITISTLTLEDPLLCVTVSGQRKINVYNLQTGDLEDQIEAEVGDTFLKIGLAPYEDSCHFIYIIVRDNENKLVGTMLDLKTNLYLWRLYLGQIGHLVI